MGHASKGAMMGIQTVVYRFSRDERTGFFSRNSASTDALNVLDRWKYGDLDRDYIVSLDEPELLVCAVTFEDKRAEVAAEQLN